MERKIGEIFEYNCEWYQCCATNRAECCNDCFFSQGFVCKKDSKVFGICGDRNFKKLEKVGEPFSCNYYGDKRLIKMQEYQLFDIDVTNNGNIPMYISNYKHQRIAIQIKKNKEDMEDGKFDPHMEKVIDESMKKMGDEISRQLNDNLNKQRMKPFNLEAAKAGKPVCTRDGRKARIICFDKKEGLPIISLVESKKNGVLSEEILLTYINGHAINTDTKSKDDLMLLTEKKSGYIHLKNDGVVFDNKEVAEKKCPEGYIVAKVEWEE